MMLSVRVGIAALAALLILPAAALAGGYGNCCCQGSYYAPQPYAYPSQPAPAVAQARTGGYQSYSYAPSTGATGYRSYSYAPAPVVSTPAYSYGSYSGYNYNRGFSSGYYNRNAASKALGNY
jgi:hypothetical protein